MRAQPICRIGTFPQLGCGKVPILHKGGGHPPGRPGPRPLTGAEGRAPAAQPVDQRRQLCADGDLVVPAPGEGVRHQRDGRDRGRAEPGEGGLLVVLVGARGREDGGRGRPVTQVGDDVVRGGEIGPAGEEVAGDDVVGRAVVAGLADRDRVQVRVPQGEVHGAVPARGPARERPRLAFRAHPQCVQGPVVQVRRQIGVVECAVRGVDALLVVAEPGLAVGVGDEHDGGRHPVLGDRGVDQVGDAEERDDLARLPGEARQPFDDGVADRGLRRVGVARGQVDVGVAGDARPRAVEHHVQHRAVALRAAGVEQRERGGEVGTVGPDVGDGALPGVARRAEQRPQRRVERTEVVHPRAGRDQHAQHGDDRRDAAPGPAVPPGVPPPRHERDEGQRDDGHGRDDPAVVEPDRRGVEAEHR